MSESIKSIIEYLPIVGVIVAASIAHGVQQQKIENLEDAIKAQAEIQSVVVDVQKQQSAADARQEIILELLKEIRQKVDK